MNCSPFNDKPNRVTRVFLINILQPSRLLNDSETRKNRAGIRILFLRINGNDVESRRRKVKNPNIYLQLNTTEFIKDVLHYILTVFFLSWRDDETFLHRINSFSMYTIMMTSAHSCLPSLYNRGTEKSFNSTTKSGTETKFMYNCSVSPIYVYIFASVSIKISKTVVVCFWIYYLYMHLIVKTCMIQYWSLQLLIINRTGSINKGLSNSVPRNWVPIIINDWNSSSRNPTESRHLINWNCQIYRAGSLTKTFPGDASEIPSEPVADSADLISSLWGIYLTNNLRIIWVPRNSAHSRSWRVDGRSANVSKPMRKMRATK